MSEQMMQEQQQPAMQEQAGPEQVRDAMASGSNPESPEGDAQEVHERFIINVMKLASGNEYDKVMAFMRSGEESPAQGFGRALFFILEAVKEGLEGKGVDIPGELYLAENGIIEQSAKIVAILGSKGGIPLDQEAVTQGIEMAAEALAETDDLMKQQQEPQQEQPQPQEQPMPQQPQQGGMLSQGGM